MFLGFDFYGAGNIGDDLMLQGFLDVFAGVSDTSLSCSLPTEWASSQRKRFNRINWLSLSAEERKRVIPDFEQWLGVGGTPFQATHGPWLLNRITVDFDAAPRTKKFMIGVGCETEVLRERALAERIVTMTDSIWTRDEASRKVLVEDLGANPDKVSLGGDLANIALKKIFPVCEVSKKSQETVGIVYFSTPDETDNRAAIKKFVDNMPSDNKPTFIANDVRKKGFERSTFKDIFGGWRWFKGSNPGFYSPDYKTEKVEGLVSHFRNFDVIMACRYHALLTAAWAGCRVVALDRSSKIRFLAAELGIPLVPAPFTEEGLQEGFQRARQVPRQLLEEKAAAAELSVLEFCKLLNK